MPYRYPLIESRQSSSCGGGCISVDKHDIGLCLLQHIPHAQKNTSRDIIQVLPCFHDVQVIVWPNIEQMQHLVQHLTMLTRHAHYGLESFGFLLKALYQRTHLDGLRTSAKNKHNLFHTPSIFYY